MIVINDTIYDADKIRENRELIILLRNAAIEDNKFDWVLALTVTIGLLNELAEIVEDKSDAGTDKDTTA